ncbi:MAG: hypothetical protein HY303_05550 [Candidatus Wallbacteria bacterium]|nr:hypothetical protein [Candidatus Wallbacteria bacterium]
MIRAARIVHLSALDHSVLVLGSALFWLGVARLEPQSLDGSGARTS